MPCKFACIKSLIIACALLASIRGPRIKKLLLSRFNWQVLITVHMALKYSREGHSDYRPSW